MAGVDRGVIEKTKSYRHFYGFRDLGSGFEVVRGTLITTTETAETVALTKAEADALEPRAGFTIRSRRHSNRADWWTVIEEKETEGEWSFEPWPPPDEEE